MARKDKDAPRIVSQPFYHTGRLGERARSARAQPCAPGAPDAAAPSEALRLRRHRAACRHAGPGAAGSLHRPLDAARRLRTRRVIRLDLRPTGGAFLVDARDVYGNATYGKDHLTGLDVDAVLAAGQALLEERPRTAAELRRLLGPRWPERDAAALAYAVRGLLPLVHVPPRGVWGESGSVALTTAESWLGQSVASVCRPDETILRYLAAFGPATVADARTWSGLGGLRVVFERLRPRLVGFRDERGRELFDVPGAPLPDPETPAPPRFLSQFDNALLSHADRTRIISDEHRKALFEDPMMRGVLLEGFACGTWTAERTRGKVTLVIQQFQRLSKGDRDALADEGERLLRLLATPQGAEEFEIRFSRKTWKVHR